MLKVGFSTHFHRHLAVLIFGLFSSAVALAQPTIATSSLDPGMYGAAYSQPVSADPWVNPVSITLLTPVPGLALTDNLDGTATLSGVPTDVNIYAISIEVRDLVDDSFTVKNLSLTIGKATLTVTAQNNTRLYGDPEPSFGVSYSGFLFSDGPGNIDNPPTATTTALVTSDVGPYDINPTGGSDNHYTFAYAPGTLTITPAPLTITADNKSRSYGAANPALTASYSGFRNSDGPGSLLSPAILNTTAVGTSPAGTNPVITVSGATSNNYSITFVNGQFTITKATITATAVSTSRLYGDANPSLNVTYSGFQNGETEAVLDLPTPVASTAAVNNTPVGSYGITLSAATDNNYTYNYVGGTLTINKAPLSATANNQSKVYGASLPTLTISYLGFKNGENASVIATPPNTSTPATSASDAGTYAISISGGSATNYDITTYTAGTLTITKAVLNARADDQTRPYGSANPTFTVSYTGFVNGDDAADIETGPTGSTAATTASAVGTYPITLAGGTDQNYTFNLTAGTLTVAKAILTVTADNKSRPYGSANPAFTLSYSGFVGGETSAVLTTTPTASTPATITTGAGGYSIIPANGVDESYDFQYVNGTLTITKVALTAKADDKNRAYGASNPPFTITYTGFVLGETESVLDVTRPTASSVAIATSPVGSYPITVSTAGALDDNYTFNPSSGSLNVQKAVITATADNKSRPYGTANPALTITYSGFVNGETELVLDPSRPTASTAATISSNAGNHPITVSGGSDDNYTYTYVAGTLQIDKVPLTVTADNKSRQYGAANPVFTFSYSGFVLSDGAASVTGLTGSTAATVTSNVGTYPIQVSGGVSTNYTLSYVDGQLSVTQAPLTITANNTSKVYGAAVPTLTVGYSGFLNGDNASVLTTGVSISTTATETSPVGTYAIVPSAAVALNYSITFANGTLNVTPAILTATANDASRTYGAANPGFTISYTGFVNGDGLGNITQGSASAPSATATSNVGTYPIVPSGASATNYTFNYVNGTLTITKATLVATANAASRTYGSPEPTFTASYSGFLNGQNASVVTTPPTGTTNATITSPTGTYDITLSGAAAQNYTFTYQPGVLTITKATLNAIAANQTKTYGALNPTLTVTYSGFKNGEDATVIDDPAVASTAATQFSNAGTYPITVSGGSDNNYTFAYTSGTLTIGKAVLLATADNKSRTYGASNPVFTLTYTGLLGADVPANIATPPTMSTVAVTTTPVGNYTISISGGSDENYTFTHSPGTLSITKAMLTARPDNASRTYGAANPSFNVTYTGFVNAETAAQIDTPASASTLAGFTSDVGTYSIDASGAIDNNYDFTYQPGTLTINKATLLATANNQSRVYGSPNPAFTINYTGFQNGETSAVLDLPLPVATTAATTASPAGSYAISVGAATDNNYSYIYVQGTLTISKAVLTVTADNKTRPYNTANPAFTLSYSGFLNGDGVGNITPPVGTTTATVASPVDQYVINVSGGTAVNYTFSYVTGILNIVKANPVVNWSNPATITYGTPLSSTQLNATANVPGTFSYTPAGGTILNAGNNQPLSVDFTPSDQSNYNTITGTTVQINVSKATPVITWSNPAAITYGTPLSYALQLNASSNIPGTFVYTPDAGAVLNAGSHNLRADFTPTDAANYNVVSNIQRPITVNKAVPVVTWNNPSPIVYGTPLGATQLNATFSVPGTATYVPGAGTILPTGSNQAIVVNFTPTDAANYQSVNGTQVLITVTKATPVITWNNPADITYGTALGATQLNATANVAGTFAYNPVSSTILTAGVGHGLSVTFTPTDAANYNSASKTVSINVNKANPVITWTNPTAITYGTSLSATQLNATANVPGSFMYSPASGTVLSAGSNQTLQTTFTPTDAANYNTIVTTRQITVNKANPVVTWTNPAPITYGTPLGSTQQSATANVPGVFEYTPPPGTILTTGVSQNISVKFTPTDAANYNVIPTTTVQITVNKATPTVTWATPLPIKILVPLSSTQLNATSTVPGTFTYTPAAGNSFSTEGNYTLHVAFTPTDAVNYNSVPDTQVQIVVSSKDNPVVTWSNPANIEYGTLLSATQLDATSNVPGTFSYTPNLGTLLNAGTAQNLSVTFTPTDGVNYNAVNKTVQINVTKKTLTATAANASRAYGNANPGLTINYSGFVGSETIAVIDTPPTATCAAIASDPAGSTFPVIPAGGADNNYSFAYVNGTLTVTKAPLIASADNKTRAYGSSNPPFTISYSGFVNGDTEASITVPAASSAATIASNVGTYAITLTGGIAANYNITLQPGTLTVTPALLVLIANDASRIYGAANPVLSFQAIGFKNGDDVSSITQPAISTTAVAASSVGTYPINLTGGSATNYTLALFSGTLTINKRALTATADNKTRMYGQSNPANSITYTGFVNGDGSASITQPTISGPAATTASDAGTYPILLSGGAATNYDLTLVNGALTVTKAPLTATAENKTRVYGSANPTFTIAYSGFINGDDVNDITPPAAGTAATAASDVGTYPISLTGGAAQNYTIAVQPGTLTITKAALVARANDRTRNYGQPNPTLTITYTSFLNGDTESDITPPTASTTATVTSNVGTYPITLSGGSATNYTITLQSGTMNVAKALLNAKADDKTKVYGTANPANSITYTGFMNGDGPASITPPTISGPSATAASPVGTYPITLTGGSGANYTFTTLEGGTLTITPAALTARADDKSRLYGASNPSFSITYTGFVAGDDVTKITPPVASTTAVATSSVGTYPITLSGTTSNYTYTFVDGTLTVNKATLTAAADNRSKTYGAANPTLTITYSGFVNGENSSVIDTAPAATTAATAASVVGTYPITASGGADNNYTFAYTPATLTITKAPLTARADNKSRFYGDPNPPLTITYTGFVNSDGPTSITQPTATTAATPSSPFGNYPINLSGGAAANYTITLQSGTLSIVPALLTVTASNQSRNYGAANPALTITYSGFMNGQTVADLDVLPTASTTATITSNAGTYPISVSGGSDPNYTFFYASGTLTINKAPLTATAESKTSTYGTIPAPTIAYTGFVNGETASVLDTPPVAGTTALPTSGPGIYPISVGGGADNNYSFTYVNGTLTLGKAPLTARADDKSRIIGLPNPVFTVSYSGFKNNEDESVLDTPPTALSIANTSSAPGTYPINVSGGSDNHYEFAYQNGTLTVVLDNPPVVKNFQVDMDEDARLPFTTAIFAANYTDEPNGKISFIKVVTLPANGTLFKGINRVVAGDEIKVTDGVLEEMSYVPNSNYNGTDNFNWNLSDGTFLAVNHATVTIKIKPVNDPPVLSNIESNARTYSLGDAPVKVTEQLIINDVDDNFVFSASVLIASNFSAGDELSIEGGVASTKVTATYDADAGELKLKGKDTRAAYQALLTSITFASPVSGEATISEKNIVFAVRDSIADSNLAARTIEITEVFPELGIVTAFTPNGDGVNDSWDILNLDNYTNVNILVFNQDGVNVFDCRSIDCTWDGKFKGQALPAGPYMYTIDVNNGKRRYKGTVTILK